MIEFNSGLGTATCDTCSNTEDDIMVDDFMEFIDELKLRGWKVIFKSAGEYSHICPSCVEDEAELNNPDDMDDHL